MLSRGHDGVRVRRLGDNRAGELRITRFLRCRQVTPETMFATACSHTHGLVHDRHVLVIQDTTSLRERGQDGSLQLHPAIAVDADDGALLGLVYAALLRRQEPVTTHCNKRALADKESRRWIDATQQAGTLLASGASRVTVIADREADIYEQFALRPDGVDVLIRAHHDRNLTDGTPLYEATTKVAELGREIIQLPAAPGRPARQATLALRATRVRIKRPKRNRAAWAAALPPHVELWLVEALEVKPPRGATPIHWRLLTTHPAGTLAEARQITAFYRRRWVIEQLFRVMKTQGFDVEALRISDDKPFENLAAAILIAAIQVQQMVHDRDGQAKRPATDVFDVDELPVLEAIGEARQGKTERQKNPHPKGSLAYATWVCARLGGWTGYYGKPGPIVILRGYLSFKDRLAGWRLARDVRIL